MATRTHQSRARKADAAQAVHDNAKGADVLGHFVTFGLSGRIPLDALRLIMDQTGFGQIKLTKVRQGTAIQRAMQEWVDAAGGQLSADGVRIDLLYNDPDKAVFAIVGKYVNRAGETARFPVEWRVIYHKDRPGDDALEFSDPAAEALVRPLVATYHQSYNAADASKAVLHPVIKDECQAVSMRRNGGAYLVFDLHTPILRNLGRFVEAYGAATGEDCYLTMLEIPNTESSRAHMKRHAHETLMGRLGEAQVELNRLNRRDGDASAGDIKPSTIKTRLAEVRAIAAQAALYRDVLALEARDVAREVTRLRGAFKSFLRTGPQPGEAGPGWGEEAALAEAREVAAGALIDLDADGAVPASGAPPADQLGWASPVPAAEEAPEAEVASQFRAPF